MLFRSLPSSTDSAKLRRLTGWAPAVALPEGIERTLAWFGRLRRLTVRYERRLDILTGSHLLAASLICLGFAGRWSC